MARALAVALVVAGCAATPRAPEPPAAGISREGRPIPVRVLGHGPRTILILATIHGNEPAGTPLVRRLELHLDARPSLLAGRRVLLVPVANPDGLARGTRRNAAGVDLNRNFPSARAPLTEPESRMVHDLILRERPDLIVSVHQPLRCIDYDGPARSLARAMAATCELPVRKLGTRPGSLGRWAGRRLGIPTITVELPPKVERLGADELWRRYGEMLLVAIRERVAYADGAAK